jgi:predicted YcjX-like family ATPase
LASAAGEVFQDMRTAFVVLYECFNYGSIGVLGILVLEVIDSSMSLFMGVLMQMHFQIWGIDGG